MLQIQQLNSGYDSLQILKDVTLTIEPGSITILMGPNGAGKSTLLRSIFNLTHIISGDIMFNGEPITHLPTHRLLQHGIAYVPQGKVNFDTLTVEHNLRLGAHHVTDRHQVADQLERIYTTFPILRKKRHALAFSLSGGQQQMLAMGRALMHAPKLLLLDEPSLGLSPKLVKEIFSQIEQIKTKFQTTVLIVEHNLKSAFQIADYGVVLVNGTVRAAQSSQELMKSDILQQVFVGTFE